MSGVPSRCSALRQKHRDPELLRELVTALEQLTQEPGHGIKDVLVQLVTDGAPGHRRLLFGLSSRPHSAGDPVAVRQQLTPEWLGPVGELSAARRGVCPLRHHHCLAFTPMFTSVQESGVR